jgi:predicted  nucleic acid-binding Zn-ribbon protein
MPHQCTGCGHTFEDGSKEMLSGCPECGGNKFQFRPAGEAAASADGTDAPTDGTDDDAAADAPEPGDTERTTPPDSPEPDTSSVAETVGRATTKVRDFVASDPDSGSGSGSDPEWPDEWESGSSIASDPPSSSDPDASSGAPDRDGADSRPSSAGGEDDEDIIDADARRTSPENVDEPKEDAAQASARTDVVSTEELDDSVLADDASARPPETDEGTQPVSNPPDTPAPDTDASTGTGSAPDGEVVSEPTGEEPDLTELREQLNDQFESIKILEPGQYELNLMELYDREEYIIALQENGRYVIQVPEQWIGDDADDR